MQGNVISYEQSMVIPKVRLCVAHRFGGRYTLGATGYCGSLFGGADALDSHYLRGKQFRDHLGMGIAAGGAVSVSVGHFCATVTYDFVRTFPNTSKVYSGAIGVSATGMKVSDGLTACTQVHSWSVCAGWTFGR